MSKAAAIHIAICLQVASENKAVPAFNGQLGPTGPANAPVAGLYDENSIRRFLANVAFRLRTDAPPLAFDWSKIDSAKILNYELWLVEDAIAGLTTEIPQAAPKEAKAAKEEEK
jgi:hypothetical protein